MSDGTLFVEERKLLIRSFIEEHGKATVMELCARFGVSSATIRNDLRDLESTGLLLRTHGGAMVKSKTGHEPDAGQRAGQMPENKRRIAEAALELIEDGDIIILDTGSTLFELARLLPRRRDITVVTNDLSIALQLEECDTVRVLVLGGIVRRGFHCTLFHDLSSRTMLTGLAVDKAFMGVNSFSLDKGASTPDINHAETKKLMMSIAAKVILLFDSSKMGRNSFALFAPTDRIDAIVTDSLRADDRARLEENGVEVLVSG